MNVLLLGSGGREHALAWKMAQSSQLDKLYIAPGNAGTSLTGENVAIAVNDFERIASFVIREKIHMVVVGTEAPLVEGIYDYFLSRADIKHIPVIGPSKEGAKLEGSKEFAKDFMVRYNIPTAAYQSFTKETVQKGLDYLKSIKPPFVLKADGLAAGKGVVISEDLLEAQSEMRSMLLDEKFGEASSKVVVEEYLKGIELSVFVLTDGRSYKILPEAKDYKRIGEGDTGLNTGGMGAISPVPFVDKTFMDKVEQRIIIPTIEGLKKEGIIYKGFLFIGLMNVEGDPYVIEYNVRMGDPETEVVIPRIESDLLDLLDGIANETLESKTFTINSLTAVTVMLVSNGYPGSYKNGKTISGLEKVKDSILFHAGTKKQDNTIITNGGRVIAITSLGKDMEQALATSYKNAELIQYEGKVYRNDIGFDLKQQVCKC